MPNVTLRAGQAPELAAARVRLMPLEERHADAVTALVSDFEVARWLSRVPHPYSRGDALRFILDLAPQELMWAIELPDRRLAGVGGFTFTGDGRDVELGYWLGRPFWGQGIATEAGAVMLGHAWRHGSERVASGYFEGNARSGNVLRKLGFRVVGRSMRLNAAAGAELAHVEVSAECPAGIERHP